MNLVLAAAGLAEASEADLAYLGLMMLIAMLVPGLLYCAIAVLSWCLLPVLHERGKQLLWIILSPGIAWTGLAGLLLLADIFLRRAN